MEKTQTAKPAQTKRNPFHDGIPAAISSVRATRRGRLLLSIAAGMLLSFSQSPSHFGWLATFTLVPFVVAARAARPIESIGLGLAMALFFGLFGSRWLLSALEAQGAFGFSGVLATGLTVFWAKGWLFGFIGGTIRALRNAASIRQVLIVATLFGLVELWIGQSRWGLPILLLGHSQLSVPGVAQLAVFGGVPLISGLLMALNHSLALWAASKPGAARIAVSLGATWLTIAALGLPLAIWGRPELAEPAAKALLLVQPDSPRSQRWESAFQNVLLENIAAQTSKALRQATVRPDAILWPENLLTTPLSRDERLTRQLQGYVDQWGLPVVTGLVRESASGRLREYRNSVVWFSPRIGELDAVDKVRAIPLVESSRDFVGRSALARLFGDSFSGPRVAEAETARPLVGEFTLSPALCFEVLFPGIVSDRRDEDSLAIVNFADDSWLAGEIADRQLITAAAFRAIEQRMTLLRISHGGLSIAIDPFGREFVSLPPNVPAEIIVDVKREAPITVFERLSIPALAVFAGVMVWWLFPGLYDFSSTMRGIG